MSERPSGLWFLGPAQDSLVTVLPLGTCQQPDHCTYHRNDRAEGDEGNEEGNPVAKLCCHCCHGIFSPIGPRRWVMPPGNCSHGLQRKHEEIFFCEGRRPMNKGLASNPAAQWPRWDTRCNSSARSMIASSARAMRSAIVRASASRVAP
jgi:hypothetical protein